MGLGREAGCIDCVKGYTHSHHTNQDYPEPKRQVVVQSGEDYAVRAAREWCNKAKYGNERDVAELAAIIRKHADDEFERIERDVPHRIP